MSAGKWWPFCLVLNVLKRNMYSGVERFNDGSSWMTIKIVYRILLFIIKVVDITDVDIVNI